MVIDASVVAKWFNNEHLTDKALEIKDGFIDRKFELYSPEHLLYEVGNSIWKNKALSVEDSISSISDLIDIGINLKGLDHEMASNAMKTAKDYFITFYDALYVQLSAGLDIPFVSADVKLLSKIEGKQKLAVHLKDYK